MTEKPSWKTLSAIWKIVVAVSVVLTILASILQISGAIDLGSLLIEPIYTFLITEIPIYYPILAISTFLAIVFVGARIKNRRKSCILDLAHARKIALLCQEPRATEHIRSTFHGWKKQANADSPSPCFEFDDCMKLLEKEGFIVYSNGRWVVTQKALKYIDRYHGRS